MGTLLCCALPATLALLAGGAAVGSLMSSFPWIIAISQHKTLLFVGSGILLGISGILTLRPQSSLACAVTGGKGCEVAGNFSRVMFWVSIAIYGIGVFSAFALEPLLRLSDRILG